MVRVIVLAWAAGLLASCTARPPISPPLAASAALRQPSPPQARAPAECAQLDASIAAEAAAQTQLATNITGGMSALSAALMASEARKNAVLQLAIDRYQQCRLTQVQDAD